MPHFLADIEHLLGKRIIGVARDTPFDSGAPCGCTMWLHSIITYFSHGGPYM